MIPAVMPTYARTDAAIVRGEGTHVWDADGMRFLDFGGGVAVTSLGHCHPKLVEALKAQAETLWHCSNLYRIPGQERVAETLVANSFADSVFFCNSGTEAVECALKMVRKFQHETGHPERYRLITCSGAFHGRTLATISAGGQEKHLQGFAPAVDGFDQVSFGNPNELRAAITSETAGILVEPIQGEGGINAAGVDYLKILREVADEFGLLLVFDEVQTGIGRTGKLFAHEWSGITPDIMAVAKGLGNGFPVGACLATETAAQGMTAGTHGSTFGGNPLAMAVAGAVLDEILEEGFLSGVQAAGKALHAEAEAIAAANPEIFTEVRGWGLMIGLRCADGVSNTDVVAACMAEGLLTVPAGDNVVRLLPPLIIEQTHVEEAATCLKRTCGRLRAQGGSQ